MSRIDRVEELIKQEIANILIKKANDHRIGFISIQKVKVTKDLSHAKVFYSQIGSDEEKKKTYRALRSASNYIKGELGKVISLKTIPTLRFIFDESIERGVELANKIKGL